VLRRFTPSWTNFEKHYRLLADAWSVMITLGLRHCSWNKGHEKKI
jgi:hypothetical protein